MKRIWQSGRNLWAALAACALVLQLAAAAQAIPVRLDIFGNPICVTASDGTQHAPSKGRHDATECCLAACGVPVAGPPPEPVEVADRAPRAKRTVFSVATPSPTARAGYRPGNPRAPPLTA